MLANKPRILFVDRDPRLLGEVQESLKRHRISWTVEIASSGDEALQRMESDPYDILIADIRMPGMNGTDFFDEMIARYPRALRFVLSDQTAEESFLKAIVSSHRILYKPCEMDFLIDTLSDALMNRDFILDKGLQEIVSQIQSLPNLPVTYAELMNEIRNSDPSLRRIGELIGRDIGLYAKILSIVNSAYFSFSHYVTDPVQAVSLIGLNRIQSLALLIGIFTQLETKAKQLENFSLQSLQNHSLTVGKMSYDFAKTLGFEKKELDSIFLSGLLHDIGWLILAAYLPDKIRSLRKAVIETGDDSYSIEQDAMGSTHASLGAYLLSLWGFPRSVVDIVACHHEPWKILNADPKSIVAVHAADSLYHVNCEEPGCLFCCQPDNEYLVKKGLMRQYSMWKELRGDMKLETESERDG